MVTNSRMTARDRQLLAVLAQARCLSDGQVKRLFWPRQARQAYQRRMSALSKGDRPLVKALHWYTRDGRRTAWALAPAGYLEAESELGEELEPSSDDIGAEYLEHHVHLSELFVGLLAGPVEERAATAASLYGARRSQALAVTYARARHPYFRWVVTGDRDLPWKQYEGPTVRERLIRPDAILEFPHAARRIFVESEMGTHSITAVSPWKPGATTAKADRYEAFCAGLSSVQPRRTWYQTRFPDGARPEVLFLVRNEGRAKSVNRALEVWRRQHPQAACNLVAATVEGALADLLPLAGLATNHVPQVAERESAEEPGRPGHVSLTLAEFGAVRRFFAATVADYKARREMARTQRSRVPDYPEAAQEMHVLVQRVRA